MSRHLFIIGIILVGMASSIAQAGKIYKFRDTNGNILFTNIVNDNGKPQGLDFQKYQTLEKVTYYKDTNVHRYRDWGSDETAILPSFSKNKDAFDPLIRVAASSFGVDGGLVKAVIHTESGFNPRAQSKPGARGLMQLMPATAAKYQVNNIFDPRQNIQAGVKHLRYLLDRYKKLELVLAAYNAGEKNVERYNGIPPFAETQDYVKRVMSRYHHLYQNGV